MPDIEDIQRLRADIRALQAELEQARVSAEDSAEQAQQSASEASALQAELRRVRDRHRLAETSIGDLRTRLANVVGNQEADRASKGAVEEELQVVVEELEVLAEELEGSNAALRLSNAELDSRVAERTLELQAANAALRDRELRLSLAMHHARASSWDWQIDNDAVNWSGEYAELYGRSELSDYSQWLAAVSPEDRERLNLALRNCAEERALEVAVDYRIEHPLKGQRWLSSRGRLIRGEPGRPAFVTGLSTDITELKAAEAVLQRNNDELSRRVAEAVAASEAAREQLFQKQKLEALGQLTGGVAHDFNNLLAVIGNGMQLISMVDDASERARLIERMQTAVSRGSALTRRLLTFGRRQTLKPELLDLRRCLVDFLELVRPSLHVNIDISGHVEPGTFPVWLDSGEMQLALLNLCVNARDAMPKGGRIEIRVRNRKLGADAPAAMAPGDCVAISVSDTGSGMSGDVLSHVFEPFFTTKDIGEGTGLGLAQVYGFVSQSGGTVYASSKPGEGTRITMLLPPADAAVVAAARAAAFAADATAVDDDTLRAHPQRRRAAGTAAILMVEDDEELGPLVEQMLQSKFRVERVLTAQAALDCLQCRSDDFDLLFTDIRLPAGISGLQLAERVRQKHPGLAVVVTTGYGGSLLADAVNAGLPVLRKPYRLDELVSVLGEALVKAAA